jgi:hypothetical protein
MERLIRWAALSGAVVCLLLAAWAALGLLLAAAESERPVVTRVETVAGLQRIVWRPNLTVARYQLPRVPRAVLVFRNGLLLSPPDDYVVRQGVIEFQRAAWPRPGDIVTVIYQ